MSRELLRLLCAEALQGAKFAERSAAVQLLAGECNAGAEVRRQSSDYKTCRSVQRHDVTSGAALRSIEHRLEDRRIVRPVTAVEIGQMAARTAESVGIYSPFAERPASLSLHDIRRTPERDLIRAIAMDRPRAMAAQQREDLAILPQQRAIKDAGKLISGPCRI